MFLCIRSIQGKGKAGQGSASREWDRVWEGQCMAGIVVHVNRRVRFLKSIFLCVCYMLAQGQGKAGQGSVSRILEG